MHILNKDVDEDRLFKNVERELMVAANQ